MNSNFLCQIYGPYSIFLFFVICLVIHFIADFVFQSDKMALNKSDSVYWLSIHGLTYTGIFTFFTMFMINDWITWILFNLINGILHTITDFFTSKATKYLWKINRHYFFVMIGFDQLIHFLTIAGILYYFS